MLEIQQQQKAPVFYLHTTSRRHVYITAARSSSRRFALLDMCTAYTPLLYEQHQQQQHQYRLHLADGLLEQRVSENIIHFHNRRIIIILLVMVRCKTSSEIKKLRQAHSSHYSLRTSSLSRLTMPWCRRLFNSVGLRPRESGGLRVLLRMLSSNPFMGLTRPCQAAGGFHKPNAPGMSDTYVQQRPQSAVPSLLDRSDEDGGRRR